MAGPKKKTTHSLSETVTTRTHLDTSSTDARPTKTLRQLHLWESHPRSEDGQSGHADQHHNMEEDASSHQSTLEEERQLQWLHRWFEESILEEPRAQRQEDEWRGSSLLRALTKQKLSERHKGKWDYRHDSIAETDMDTLSLDTTGNTLQAILCWLSWITEQEIQQTTGPQLH
jgi:hypothetical protein